MGHDPWGCLTAAFKSSLRLNSSFPLYCKLCHCFPGLISPFPAVGKYFWVTLCPLVASAEEMAALKHPGCLGEAAGIFAGSPWGLGSFLAQGVWDSCHFCLSHSLSGFQSSIFMLCPREETIAGLFRGTCAFLMQMRCLHTGWGAQGCPPPQFSLPGGAGQGAGVRGTAAHPLQSPSQLPAPAAVGLFLLWEWRRRTSSVLKVWYK